MRNIIMVILGIVGGVAIGYYLGQQVSLKQSEVASASYHLHEAIGYASVCGNQLHYANPEVDSQAAKYSMNLYLLYAKEAITMMDQKTTLFFPVTTQKEGLIRGREYMTSKGCNEQAAQANSLLAAITKCESAIDTR